MIASVWYRQSVGADSAAVALAVGAAEYSNYYIKNKPDRITVRKVAQHGFSLHARRFYE